MDLTKETEKYINSTDIKKRKKLGQYFTPRNIRDRLLSFLPTIDSPKILEPSCGTGEFLLSIDKYFNNPKIDAFDIDPAVLKIAKKQCPRHNIKKQNALCIEFSPYYDFVIGNPPFFEFVPDQYISGKYENVINGRANMYGLFIKLGIEVLKPGGYLAYVVPPSMNNGAFFYKLRQYIIRNANIENIELFNSDLFDGAQQNVMVLVLKKTENKGSFIFKRHNNIIFTKEYKMLSSAFEESISIKEAGFSVKTGSVVWNKNKDLLTKDPNDTTLIWAHNIVNGKISINNNLKKPQYIKVPGSDEKVMVVNRITGSGNKAKIRAAITDGKIKWVAENHVNVIRQKENKISIEDLFRQITSDETAELIKHITGNTQISKSEIENLIPVKV